MCFFTSKIYYEVTTFVIDHLQYRVLCFSSICMNETSSKLVFSLTRCVCVCVYVCIFWCWIGENDSLLPLPHNSPIKRSWIYLSHLGTIDNNFCLCVSLHPTPILQVHMLLILCNISLNYVKKRMKRSYHGIVCIYWKFIRYDAVCTVQEDKKVKKKRLFFKIQ